VIYAAMTAGAAVGIFSWNRYLAILLRALRYSQKSTCEKCGAYSRFGVLDSTRAYAENDADGSDGPWLKVKCLRCGNEWTMA
jgi:hypothetical protein